MKLMDDGIKNTKVKEGLKQLQKKLVNAGRKSPPSTAKRTDIGGSLYMVFWYLVRHACFAFLCYNTSPCDTVGCTSASDHKHSLVLTVGNETVSRKRLQCFRCSRCTAPRKSRQAANPD